MDLLSLQSFPLRSPTPDLLSEDMRIERERRRWEEQAGEEVGGEGDRPVDPIHYQSVRGGEVRSHGVGYYAFSTDVDKRKEEMEMLAKLRDQVRGLIRGVTWLVLN